MHRIDGDGHVANQFTEGTPGVTPATQVTDDWLNDVQEELCNFIEDSPASVTLVKGTQTQLIQAFTNRIAAFVAGAVTWGAGHIFNSSVTVNGNATFNSLVALFTKGLAVTQSQTNGNGVEATGNGSGRGVTATGGSSGAGVYGTGGGSAAGVSGTGGDTNGAGVTGTGGATNGKGVIGTGTGSGEGGHFTGGTSGDGVYGAGGTNKAGGVFVGNGSGAGASITGGSSGHGAYATGGGTGAGVVGIGGANGNGAQLFGNANRAPLLLVPQASDPANANQGDLYVNSGDGTLRIYNGSAWVKVGTQT